MLIKCNVNSIIMISITTCTVQVRFYAVFFSSGQVLRQQSVTSHYFSQFLSGRDGGCLFLILTEGNGFYLSGEPQGVLWI